MQIANCDSNLPYSFKHKKGCPLLKIFQLLGQPLFVLAVDKSENALVEKHAENVQNPDDVPSEKETKDRRYIFFLRKTCTESKNK